MFRGHGRQYRQYRQFRQYRQRQWAGRQRLGTRPPTGYVPVPLDGVPVIGAFAHLREVDLPRLGLSAEVVGRATAVHAAAIGGAGSRAGGCGGTARPNPLPLGTFAGPLVAGGAGRDHPRPPAPDAPVARALSQSLPEGERFRDALPHGHLCVSPLRGERAPTRGAPTRGIDSRGRGNDGYGRGLQGFPAGAGRDHPSHPPPTRLWRVPSLSLSQRERGLGMRSPTVTLE